MAKGLFQIRMTNIDFNLSVSVMYPSSSWKCQPAKSAVQRNDLCEWHLGGCGERVRVHFRASTGPRKETAPGERGEWEQRLGSKESGPEVKARAPRNLQESQEGVVAHPPRLQDVNAGLESMLYPSCKRGALCWHVGFTEVNKAESQLKGAYSLQFKIRGRCKAKRYHPCRWEDLAGDSTLVGSRVRVETAPRLPK